MSHVRQVGACQPFTPACFKCKRNVTNLRREKERQSYIQANKALKPASIFIFYRSLLPAPDHGLQTFLGDATLKQKCQEGEGWDSCISTTP